MSLPHDYYDPHHPPEDDRPDLHNKHESWPYLDPDYWANWHDDQLPLISTVGRGPRGEGLEVGNVVDEDGNVSFGLYSTLTGELAWQSPNLAPASISFTGPTDWRKLVPGVHAPLDINVTQGGVTKTTTVYLPAGQRGSLVYLLDEMIERKGDDTYSTTIGKLTVYGKTQFRDKPTPRPNDVVFFPYTSGDEQGFAFGTVEDVGGYERKDEGKPLTPATDQVIFTARTFVPVSALPAASITEVNFAYHEYGTPATASMTRTSVLKNEYRLDLSIPLPYEELTEDEFSDLEDMLYPVEPDASE